MATYLLAYFGYQEWKTSSETPNETVEKVTEQNSNKCEIILDSLRKVNKKLLLLVFILLTIILLLMVLRRFINVRKYRKERNHMLNKNYNLNC